MRSRLRSRAALFVFALAAGACSGGAGAPSEAKELPAAPRPKRDPELAEVRTAIEQGHGERALLLLERQPGFEAECLRARAESLESDPVAALAAIERARSLAPDRAELWATEAEVLAALDRIQAAADSLIEGRKRAGADPELLRAQGVIELRNQGHGKEALAALERARAGDPDLPFLAWPLAQAHLLVGRERLEKAPLESLAHARAALELEPEGVYFDARELEAEALGGAQRFEEALVIYAELEGKGRAYGETPGILEQRCATRCLMEHDREGAVQHYLAARARGLSDRELGYGLEVLDQERSAALERGIAAADGQEWEQAEKEFARALELVPGDVEAENHLGVARFERADYRGAAEAWQAVLNRAEKESLVLPDPVPLNLARAWRILGERQRARATLEHTIDRDPEGPWSEQARELLSVLEAEELAGR